MKIHEYQAKELLKDFAIPIQDGVTIEDFAQAEAALEQVEKEHGAGQFVIKAQVHAGGRGKGGGVKFSTDKASALENIKNILGMTLITHQTGPEGRLVKKVMVAQALDIAQEFYAAITLDRAKGQDVFMVSSEGGMEIEEVAKITSKNGSQMELLSLVRIYLTNIFGKLFGQIADPFQIFDRISF